MTWELVTLRRMVATSSTLIVKCSICASVGLFMQMNRLKEPACYLYRSTTSKPTLWFFLSMAVMTKVPCFRAFVSSLDREEGPTRTLLLIS